MTSSEVPTPVNSPRHAPSTFTQDTKKESIEETLRKPFKPLDIQSVTSGYDAEFVKLSQYEAEFNDMLLSAMLDARAWALARPVSAQDATGDALADRMEQVKKTEEDQGRSPFFEQTRLRLLNFINSIKSALAALTTTT